MKTTDKVVRVISMQPLLNHKNGPLKAKDLGALQNALGILDHQDRSKFHPQAFASATGLNPSKVSRVLKIPRPNVYREIIPIPKRFESTMIQIVLATDLAFGLMAKDVEETKRWLMTPNTILLGTSPFEAIMRGDGPAVIDWLAVRSGLKPGAAF